MAAMSYVHCRRIGIFVKSYHFHSVSLEFKCYFLSEFAGSAQDSLLT